MIFACFAAAAASVERPPDPAAVPEGLDEPEELDEPVEPDEVDADPVGLAELVVCCWASCFCTVLRAEA